MTIEDLDYSELLRKFEAIYTSNSPFKKEILDNPFDSESINKILEKGYSLNFYDFKRGGFCNFETKEIKISNKITGFERDVCICHEAVHAFYEEISWDYYNDIPCCIENKIITEVLARKIRASPKILVSILDGFKIPSQIYDSASFAGSLIRGSYQKILPFTKDLFSFTRMDYSFHKEF